LTILIAVSLLASGYAQSNEYGLSYKVIFPKNLEEGPISDLWETEDFSLGAQLGYRKDFSKWFTLEVPFRIGSVEVLEESTGRYRERNFFGLDGLAIAGIDPINNPFAPYAFVGVGADYQNAVEDFNVYIPAGFGVNIKVLREFLLNAEVQRRTSFDNLNTHYQISAGFIMNFNLPDKEEKPVDLEMPEVDADGDGVPDSEDACPTLAGPAMFKGCPDSDNDGIIDSKDKCPDEAGPIATDGCPVKNPNGGGMGDLVDSDGDGISDDNDNCPDEAGLERFFGCPDTDGDGVSDDKDACPGIVGLPKFSGCPDTDGDGITDDSDNCPTVPGKSEYNGCPNPPSPLINTTTPSTSTTTAPPITTATVTTLATVSQKVEFETSRATLRTISYEALDQVVSIMNQYPSYYLEVAGHTDSIGNSAGNQKLSENRAKSCKDYLIRKGISANRITTVGFGEKQPIADNRYRDGRKTNRRVEFRLIPR